jgi:hypothetical protein
VSPVKYELNLYMPEDVILRFLLLAKCNQEDRDCLFPSLCGTSPLKSKGSQNLSPEDEDVPPKRRFLQALRPVVGTSNLTLLSSIGGQQSHSKKQRLVSYISPVTDGRDIGLTVARGSLLRPP